MPPWSQVMRPSRLCATLKMNMLAPDGPAHRTLVVAGSAPSTVTLSAVIVRLLAIRQVPGLMKRTGLWPGVPRLFNALWSMEVSSAPLHWTWVQLGNGPRNSSAGVAV